jgi:uncharacterized delta-60 repeat protein
MAKVRKKKSSVVGLAIGVVAAALLIAAGGFFAIITQARIGKSSFKPLRCSVEDTAYQKDGKQLFAGTCLKSENLPLPISKAGFIFRTNKDFSLDDSFGDNGRLFLFSDSTSVAIKAIEVDEEKQFFVAGNVNKLNSETGQDIFTMKFDLDGKLDTGYGNGNGYFTFHTPESHSDNLEEALLQPDHCLLLAGWSLNHKYENHTLLRKIYPEGGIVDDFAKDGNSIKGRILAATTVHHGSDILITGEQNNDLLVARFDTQGRIKKEFSENGVLALDIKGNDRGSTLTIQQDSHIVIGGASNIKTENRLEHAQGFLLRMDHNGNLDPHFGTDGLRDIENSQFPFTEVQSIFFDKKNRVLVAGNGITTKRARRIFLNRFSPFGNKDPSFATEGQVVIIGELGSTTPVSPEDITLAGSSQFGSTLHLHLDSEKQEMLYADEAIPQNETVYTKVVSTQMLHN